MRKTLIVFFCCLCVLWFLSTNKMCFAESNAEQIYKELSENVNNQLNKFDFTELDKELGKQENPYDKLSFVDRVKKIIEGDINLDYNSFISYLLTSLFDEILKCVPIFCLIVSVAIICNLVGQLGSNRNSVGNVVYFVCFAVIVVLIFKYVLGLITTTKTTLSSLSNQIQIIFPILLTLITALGGVVSAGIYQPAMSVLSSVISELFISILMPIFIFSFVFNIMGNISPNIKMEKFAKFFSSLFKWLIGIVFTLFVSFISIQGITAISADSISIKTAKFALKSYVPFLGGYLSDGISLIMASSVLVKNGIGVTGLILMFSTILSPVLKILIFMLGLKLVAGILEPLTEKRISEFVYGVSKSLSMLIACIVGMGFMYLISIGLVMCSANIF